MAVPSDRQLFRCLLRKDFGFFVTSFFQVVRPEVALDEAWYVGALCHALAEMVRQPGGRLIVNLPPRALKSTLASVLFAAWYLGRNPEKRVLCASYNEQLARQFSRDFRRVIEHPLFREAFPQFRPGSKSTETEIFTSLNGYRIATSVGGTLTGRGANLIIVDDPINASEITSESERNRSKDWFDKVVQSRLDRQHEDHILVVMQRLHEDDLTGHLLAKESGWAQLCFPIRNTGEDRLIPLGTWQGPSLGRGCGSHAGDHGSRHPGAFHEGDRRAHLLGPVSAGAAAGGVGLSSGWTGSGPQGRRQPATNASRLSRAGTWR